MDILQLYDDYTVEYKTEGHKHCRPGWVNTECPFCEGNFGYHLGYNFETDRYVCWRCGVHPTEITVSKLLKVNYFEAVKIVKNYGLLVTSRSKEPTVKFGLKSHKLPTGTRPLTERHKRYLEGRNFDPERLEREWNLLGTGPVSSLDHIDYKHRIVIPFMWDERQVSFDSRDITGKHPFKYMACPAEREIISHKDILYGRQDLWGENGICVEGPTDVWRFGPSAFAVSGIKFTPRQVRRIGTTFKRVGVCFDGGEPQALSQAQILIGELRFRGVDAFRVDIEGDPGDMDQAEANYLVKQLIK